MKSCHQSGIPRQFIPTAAVGLILLASAQPGHAVINLLGTEDRKEALMLLGYPKDSVGRLMSPDFSVIHPEQAVGEAIDSIRQQAPDSETNHMVYVVDDQNRLLDDIRPRRLILADPARKVSDLMGGEPVALNAFDHDGEAISRMQATGYFALPVVDSDRLLPGVVTADDILGVLIYLGIASAMLGSLAGNG